VGKDYGGRQWLERRLGAFHHYCGLRRDGQPCLCAIYPIAVPAIAFVLSLFLMSETRERSIWEEPAAQKA